MRQVCAAVDLRHRATRSRFVTSPISSTSKARRPARRPGRSSSRRRSSGRSRRSTSCIRPLRALAVDGDAHLGVLPAREHATAWPAGTRPSRRAPSRSRSRAARSRRSCRRSRRSRTSAASLARPGAIVARPRSIVAYLAVQRDVDRDVELRGMPKVRTKSQPVPRGITASSTPRSRDAVHDLVHGAVAADDDEQRRAVVDGVARELDELAAALGEERVARRGRAPRARCAISGQRLPVEPPADAGLTRKTVPQWLMVARSPSSSASRVMRSTAARSSSSEMRVNSPSTTMSLTVSRQPAWTPRSAATREERRGLHLDGEDAALRPALVLALVRVVEEVARDDRADVQLAGRVLRDVHGLVDELPARGRAVRLVADEVHRGRVGGDGADRDDQVAERVIGLQPAAGADADAASCSRAGSAPRRRSSRPGSPCPCPAPRRACPPRCRCSRAGRARRSAARRRRGRSRRCTCARSGSPGKEDGLGIVAGLGSDVDRHGAQP